MNNRFDSIELATDRCIMRIEQFSPAIDEIEEVSYKPHYEADPVAAAEKRQLRFEHLEQKNGEPVPFIPGVNMDETDLDEQKRLFASALASTRGVFAIDDTELGCTDLVKHNIDTGNAIPVKQRAF